MLIHKNSFGSAYGSGSFSGGLPGSANKRAGTLYLMLGYPGAGKTTVAKIIAELTNATRISSDEMRLKLFPNLSFTTEEHHELYKQIDAKTLRFLSDGKSVVYDANLNRYIHRKQKYELCKQTGAKPVLVWVQTPRDIAKQRATHKNREHLVPKDETPAHMFDRIADIIEEPDASEHAVVISGQGVTQDVVKQALGL